MSGINFNKNKAEKPCFFSKENVKKLSNFLNEIFEKE